jgi:dienelactone hydrolase
VKKSRVLIAALVAALEGGTAVADPSNGSVALPFPEDDPFYAVPQDISGLANGTILQSRPVEVSDLGIPMDVTAWQIEYKSLDNHDQPTAMVTTALVPKAPWTGSGTRPVVSYQVPEDSSDPKCAVSYALRSGAAGAALTQSNSSQVLPLISEVLARGYAVVTSDYEGPTSAFLSAAEEAHGVLDGIRAALAYAPAGLGDHPPLALMGYSGGGYATAVAADRNADYAPELRFAGVVVGAPPDDLKDIIEKFSGTIAGGAIAMAFGAWDRANPDEDLTQYLNAEGRQAVADEAHACLGEASLRYPNARFEQWQAAPDTLDNPNLTAFLSSNSLNYLPGHPIAPVYFDVDGLDELGSLPIWLQTARQWCAAGASVDTHVAPVGPHVVYQYTSVGPQLDWLTARFAEQPLAQQDVCQSP